MPSDADKLNSKQPAGSPTRFSELKEFLTPQILGILFAGSILGLFSAVVELLLAASIQFFLADVGLIPRESIQPPRWFPSSTMPQNIFLLLISLVLARGAMTGLQPYLQGMMVENFRRINRERILDWSFHARGVKTGQLQALFTEIVNGASLMMRVVQYSFVQVIFICILLVNLFALSWVSTISLLLALSLMALPIRRAASKLKKYGGKMVREWEATQEILSGSMKNILLLRIYGTAEKECDKAKQTVRTVRDNFMHYYAMSSAVSNMPLAAGTILILSALYYFSERDPALSGALLLSYFYLFVRMVQSGALLVNAVSDISFYSPQFSQLLSWWRKSYRPSLTERESLPGTVEASLAADSIGWELSDVGFDYQKDQDNPLIRGLSFRLAPGKCLGIVGASGSGKSTILGLMLGENRPTAGAISILDSRGNTFPLDQVKKSLKENLGYVGPENFLLADTIRNNLQYGLRHPASEEEIRNCLQMAACDFVWQMPLGLDHYISEQGEGLSAGQKQRLSLARALLRKPKALILDEATANLDTRTEEEIIRTLDGLKERLTIVMVSHREPILRLADQVIRL